MKLVTLLLALLLTGEIAHAQVTPTSLSDMVGKHYAIVSLQVSDDLSLPFEGDLCITPYGIMIVYGDGNGYADEFHIYTLNEASNKLKWKISSDGKNGFLQLYPNFSSKNSDKILISITDSSKSNTFILINKPHDTPTLKER